MEFFARRWTKQNEISYSHNKRDEETQHATQLGTVLGENLCHVVGKRGTFFLQISFYIMWMGGEVHAKPDILPK